MNHIQRTFDDKDYDLYDPVLKIMYKIKDTTKFWLEANSLPGHFERCVNNDHITYTLVIEMNQKDSENSVFKVFDYLNQSFMNELKFDFPIDFRQIKYLNWKHDDMKYIFYVPTVQFHFRDIEEMNKRFQTYFDEINAKADWLVRSVKFMHRGMCFPLNLHKAKYKLLNYINHDGFNENYSLESFCQEIPVVLNNQAVFELHPEIPDDNDWFEKEQQINQSNQDKFDIYLPYIMTFHCGECYLLE